MKRISKIFLLFTLILLGCWLLPWCFTFFSTSGVNTPFTLYSSVLHDFVSMQYVEGEGVVNTDGQGRRYTREETDSLLPCFYVRQLSADGRFPSTIEGVSVAPRDVRLSNFTFRSNAYDLNAPTIGLHFLMESMSGRVDLELPGDVFRLTSSGIEFVVMDTNETDPVKSHLFTEAMQKKGFQFPARCLAGNPNPRKDYDEGYLIIDAAGHLFHLKQVKGRPYVRPIALPDGLDVRQLYITEYPDRQTLGYLVSADHHFYVLRTQTYDVVRTGVPSFNPFQDDCMIIGNPFYWTVCVRDAHKEHYYALNAHTLELVKTLEYDLGQPKFSILSFTSFKDKYVKPRLF